MYAGKLLSKGFARREFSMLINEVQCWSDQSNSSCFFFFSSPLDLLVSVSWHCSQRSCHAVRPALQSARSLSMSRTLLTRSGSSSFTTRDMGQSSRGNLRTISETREKTSDNWSSLLFRFRWWRWSRENNVSLSEMRWCLHPCTKSSL